MKSYLLFSLAIFAAVPCFANSNEGAPQYSDEAIYNSLPKSSEVLVDQDTHGNPVFQRSNDEYTCTARMRVLNNQAAETFYSCMRNEAPAPAPAPVPPGA